MSLLNCLAKAGKVFTKEERRALYDDAQKRIAEGASKDEAETAAVEAALKEAQADRQEVLDMVAKAVPGFDAQPENKISDFGEKIGGARKDVWSTFKQKMKDASGLDVAAEPLSKSWPEPDYQGLLDTGAEPWSVAFMHAARDEIPAKPRQSWKVKRWAEQVTQLRDFAMRLADGSLSSERAKQELAAMSKMSRGFADMVSRIELYELVGHSQSLDGVRVRAGEYSLYEGKQYNPAKVVWSVEKDVKATALSNWPKMLATGATKAEALSNFKERYASLVIQEPAAKETTFDIFSKRTENGYWIGKKIGRNPILLDGPFNNIKEARAYKEEHHDELVAKLEKAREIPQMRRDTNEPRIGEDMRNGQSVTPQMFAESFGFRGVEFGNWVEQGKRQKDLNDAYDALMDMAAILNVPPKALSLNGELGLAFGARGTGGVEAAKAHYEPGHIVINLTKKEGAGSLGHEWWHALDNYFSRMRAKGADFVTEDLDVSLAARGSNYVHKGEVRKEMVDAFGQVVRAIRETAMKARSAKLDAKRGKDYWTTGREMSARAYESYLISKLQDQNASNDYLANIVDEATWKAAESLGFELGESYPYPTAGEVPKIRAAFDNFFSTVEKRETDKGIALASRAPSKPAFNEALTEDEARKRGFTLKAFRGVERGRPFNESGTVWASTNRDVAEAYAREVWGFDDPEVIPVMVKTDGIPVRDIRKMDETETAALGADEFGNPQSVGIYRNSDDSPLGSSYPHTAIHVPAENVVMLRDRAPTSRGKPAFERTEEGPVIVGKDGVGIVQPSIWETRHGMTMYEHTIAQNGEAIGVVTLGWIGDKVAFLPNIRLNVHERSKGMGESVIRSLVEHNGPGQDLTIGYIAPSAREFWSKMGVRIEDTDEGTFGQISLESHRDARPVAEGSDAQRSALGEGTEAGREEQSPAAKAQGLKPEQVRSRLIEAFGPKIDALIQDRILNIVETPSDLPQNLRSVSASSDEAWYDPNANGGEGGIFMIASQLKPDRVVPVLLHELGEHYNLPKMLGSVGYANLQRELRALHARGVSSPVEDAWRHVTENYPDLKETSAEFAAEVIAKVGETADGRNLPIYRRVLNAVKAFLLKLGLKLDMVRNLSDEDLRLLVETSARQAIRRAGEAAPVRGGPMAAKRDVVNTPEFKTSDRSIMASRGAAEAIPSTAFASARQMFDTVTRSDRTLNRVISKFNTPFHIAETHPEFKPVYQEAQDFNQDVSRVANETADLAPDLLPRIESFSDFKKSAPSNADISATANALYAGTLWGNGSPMEGRAWTDEELKSGRAVDGDVRFKAFEPLNDAQIKLYRQALASVGHSLTEHAKSLVFRLAKQKDIQLHQSMSLDRMVKVADEMAATQIEGKRDAARDGEDEIARRAEREIEELEAFRKSLEDIKAKTDGLIEHGYFPAMRFGAYAVNVQTMGEDGKWKEEYFGRFETQAAANLAKAELQSEYPKGRVTSGVMNEDAHKLFQGLNLDALELFSQHMKDDNGKSIATDPLMQEYFRVATTERSSLKRQIHRKGTPGFSRDVPRALAQFTVSNATSASRNYHAADMLAKVQKIKAGDLQAYATRYVRYLQDPQEENPALRGFLANYYILGSIAFGAVNMTQPVLMTAPYLSAHTSWANAMKQLGKAAKDIVSGRANLTADEKAAYEKATKAGIVSPQEIHQIRAESRASMMGDSPLWQKLEGIAATKGITLPGKLLMRKAAFLWGSIYSMTEQFNRGTTFLAAYRIGKANNEDAYEFAKNTVDATQGVYARSNRPEVSRGNVGSVLMTFKQFNISYLELAKRLYKQDKKAFAILMLTLTALAGAEGLPFAEDIEDLIDTIGQWMGYSTNSKKKLRKLAVSILGKDIADIMLHGASAIPGVPIDVANRMGMHNIIPGSAMMKTSEPDKTRDIMDILGPAAALFKNVGAATQGVATGKFGETKQLLPSAIQNVLKGAEMVDTGQYKDMKGRKVMDVDGLDAFVKLIGFQPSKIAAESRIVSQNQQDIALQKVMESSIADQWAHGIIDKDQNAVKDARDRWREWNATNPELRIKIDYSQISRRVKDMRTSREERFLKTAPKEIRNDVARDLRP